PRGSPELHRIFPALPRVHDFRTSWRCTLLQFVPARRARSRRRETLASFPAGSAHRGPALRPLRGGRVRRGLYRTEHSVLLLLPPIWAGSVHPWSDLLRDPARHRAVVPPGGANRSADRPATDDGLYPRAFERVAHRRGVRSDGLERGR